MLNIPTPFADGSVKLLVIANHQSTADVPLMMQSFSARSRWTLLWVMDAVFKWTNFGVVSQVHGDYFLRTKSYTTGSMTKHCLRSYSQLKNAILLFPEGKTVVCIGFIFLLIYLLSSQRWLSLQATGFVECFRPETWSSVVELCHLSTFFWL